MSVNVWSVPGSLIIQQQAYGGFATATSSIPATTATPLALNTTPLNGNIVAVGSGVTIPYTGVYQLTYCFTLSAASMAEFYVTSSTSGNRLIDVYSGANATALPGTKFTYSTTAYLTANDTIMAGIVTTAAATISPLTANQPFVNVACLNRLA